MKILDEKRAPNPRRVRVFLAEKAIAVPFENVEIMTGAHKTEAFAGLNPVQRVPVLVLDDGTAISESLAICRYFEALQPEPPLFGRTPLEVATVEMWNRIAELSFFLPVTHCFRHSHPAMSSLEVPQVAAWAEANKPRVSDIIRTLDRRLSEAPYLAGERFSVADITAMIATDFMKPTRLAVPEGVPHFARWYAEVTARPSSKA
ncbi:glutathione S-transferase [Rhodomicrobium vannielii ATCC 17100]|uniref:glutathione S-transferase family protein n=1 Tax=Rhodomicrobium vannielii TaxID=1069 RepID=UPI00191AC8F7|nr:glutathione S-transferase [Rhodomicrobium vannielii]MBJ7534671.1 glutathione S-transferase [Rhodomicrobium vannielii ATCC 17100]